MVKTDRKANGAARNSQKEANGGALLAVIYWLRVVGRGGGRRGWREGRRGRRSSPEGGARPRLETQPQPATRASRGGPGGGGRRPEGGGGPRLETKAEAATRANQGTRRDPETQAGLETETETPRK